MESSAWVRVHCWKLQVESLGFGIYGLGSLGLPREQGERVRRQMLGVVPHALTQRVMIIPAKLLDEEATIGRKGHEAPSLMFRAIWGCQRLEGKRWKGLVIQIECKALCIRPRALRLGYLKFGGLRISGSGVQWFDHLTAPRPETLERELRLAPNI